MLKMLIGPISELAGTFIKNKAAEKQAVHDSKMRRIQADADWETTQAEASKNSWNEITVWQRLLCLITRDGARQEI